MLKASDFVPHISFMVFALMTACAASLLGGCNDDDDKTTIVPVDPVATASQPASSAKPPALDCAPK